MTKSNLPAISASAQGAGISAQRNPSKVTGKCPYGELGLNPGGHKPNPDRLDPHAAPRSYEYCDIKRLTIELAASDKSATIHILKDRTREGVTRSVVPDSYQPCLSAHDLVIEALADAEDVTDTYDGVGAAIWGDSRPKVRDSDERNPLAVMVTAVNEYSHARKSPAHPRTVIDTAITKASDGGAPVAAKCFAKDPGGIANTGWGFLWPFSESRAGHYQLRGLSCGVRPIPQQPINCLSALLIVYPYEEWTISIGFTGIGGASISKESNRAAEKGGKNKDIVGTVTTVKKRSGGKESTTQTTTFDKAADPKKRTAAEHQERSSTSETKIKYTLLGSESATVENVRQTYGQRKSTENKTDSDPRKVSIQRKIGGRVVETDVSGTLKKIWQVKELFDDATKLFESVKIGWSVSASCDFFSGNLEFKWGLRWPPAYTEDARVYYVERFISVGGKCDLFSGSLTGFFGFAVDPWFAPVAIEVGAYLTSNLKLTVSANCEWTYTNPKRSVGAPKAPLDPSGTATLELGVKANGRAFGYSVESRLALEGEIKLEGKGEIGPGHPPYLAASLTIGKQASATSNRGKEARDAVRLVGELIATGKTVKRYAIEPIVLIKGTTVFKDKPIFGEVPKT